MTVYQHSFYDIKKSTIQRRNGEALHAGTYGRAEWAANLEKAVRELRIQNLARARASVPQASKGGRFPPPGRMVPRRVP